MFPILSVCVVLLFLILSLYKDWFQPAISFLIAVLALSFLQILPAEEILQGFASKEIASILLLIVFGNILGKSSLFDVLFHKAFQQTNTYTGFLSRLLPSVTTMSAFMNNTPIVALLIPYVYRWGKQNNIAVSRLLIPLSFAAILGGTITLVGTSTNMLVNAFATSKSNVEFHVFDFVYVGIPVSIIGLLYIIFFGKKILPSHQTVTEKFQEDSREYLVEVKISSTSKLKGKSIAEANLRKLNGLYVVEIIRDNYSIAPVGPKHILQENDLLVLAGNVKAVTELVDSNPDLSLVTDFQWSTDQLNLVELVVTRGSYMANTKLQDSEFRSRYNAALVGINRHGEQLKGKLGDKIIRVGDTLLVLVGQDFETNSFAAKDFYLISKLAEFRSLSIAQSIWVSSGLVLAILLSALQWLPLFSGLLLLLLITLLTRVLDFTKLHQYMDYNLLVIAALALSLGSAIEHSGIGELLAQGLTTYTQPLGPVGALIGIYLLTFLFTELMTNIAAASIALPFGLAVAHTLGVSPEPFFLVIAYAASASFITPIGYQTNLMVYGPGGYRFKDFLIFGLPLTILYFVLCIAIVYIRYFL